MKKYILVILGVIAVSVPLFPPSGTAETVVLPLTIDYPLLRTLVVKQTFTDPAESAVLVNEEEGCRRIVVSAPAFSMADGNVRFESKVSLRIGFSPGNTCLFPIEWEGYVVLFQKPVLDDQWILSFETVDSEIFDRERRPAWLAGFLWDRAKAMVHEYLEQIVIDLAPPVEELKTFLEPLFPPSDRERAQRLIASMRPGKAAVAPGALKAEILADVEPVREPVKAEPGEDLPQEKMRAFIHLWEAWDETLVRTLSALSKEPLTEEDRRLLLETLLATRHEFTARLLQVKPEKDFVRRQFVDAWKRLSPVYRRHLVDDPSRSILNYLAFFTASDALVTLDRIGPALGIEISRDGLIRLLGMIEEGTIAPLDYLPGVDPALRRVLGLGPPLAPAPRESEANQSIPAVKRTLNRIGNRLAAALIAEARAESPVPGQKIRPWVVPRENPGPYVERVRNLLAEAADRVLASSGLPREHRDLYRRLVPATAWQESCFRQFEEKNGDITYLVSYNGTSVGLMQINERVWRGIYDQEELRWNIRYNAGAGCEILRLYFNRYALKKMQKQEESGQWDEEVLARIVYAMYNGGPAQFRKFLKRHREGNYYLSDRLFFEKYRWVTDGRWEKVVKCL
jgi:hypothetical protein